MNLKDLIKKIESEDPSTGICAAAATAGLIATSLVIKVAKKSGLEELKKNSEETKENLTRLIKEDRKAYKAYAKAYKSKDEEKIKQALEYAIQTPMMIAEQAYKVMELAERVLERGKKSMVLEAYGAAMISKAAVEAAIETSAFMEQQQKDKPPRLRKYELRKMAKKKEEEITAKALPYIYKA